MSHPTHPSPLDKEDEDEVYEDEEGLGPPRVTSLGAAALFPRKAQPHQAFCCDSGPQHWVARSARGPAQLSPEGLPILHLSCSHQTTGTGRMRSRSSSCMNWTQTPRGRSSWMTCSVSCRSEGHL